MSGSIPESDWKYLRDIQSEMLDALCARINRQAKQLLESETGLEHDRYRHLYKYVKESDKLMAACFDDWRRSNIWLKIPVLRREGLLTDEHLSHMSNEVRILLEKFKQLAERG